MTETFTYHSTFTNKQTIRDTFCVHGRIPKLSSQSVDYNDSLLWVLIFVLSFVYVQRLRIPVVHTLNVEFVFGSLFPPASFFNISSKRKKDYKEGTGIGSHRSSYWDSIGWNLSGTHQFLWVSYLLISRLFLDNSL